MPEKPLYKIDLPAFVKNANWLIASLLWFWLVFFAALMIELSVAASMGVNI